jgi:cytochrome oxidase Cu insertion factor (SCO1/SenC/PrrC family)
MKATLLWLMILVAAATGYIFFKMLGWREQARNMNRYDRVDYAKLAKDKNLGPREFVLTDQDGQLFTSDMLRGKVWVLSFFFQNCTKECLELNKKLAELQQDIKNPDLHFVSVTCNPEIDTPADLQRYQQGFRGDPLRWHMLTGNFDYIAKNIADPVKLTYKRSDHSQYIVIIGRDGLPKEYIGLLPGSEDERAAEMDRTKKKIAELLAEPVPDLKKEAEQQSSKQPAELDEVTVPAPTPAATKQTRRAWPRLQLAEVAR